MPALHEAQDQTVVIILVTSIPLDVSDGAFWGILFYRPNIRIVALVNSESCDNGV
jgi:hypothetical protein